MFLEEIKNFSKQNWWIYLLLAFALILVYISWKWNLVEIFVLFLANFLWNLFIMVMQKNYTSGNTKTWAIYHLSSTLVFSLVALYGFIFLNQAQYIIWQISYLIAAIKSFFFYVLNKNLKIFNEYFLIILNSLLTIFFIFFWKNFWLNVDIWSIIMAFWFSFVTTWLVSNVDKFRFLSNLIWIVLIIVGSGFWIVKWYINGNIDWLSIWYMILTLTTFVFYIKLLKNYLK